MAGYVLHLSTEENITLSSATVKRLIAGGSGDAALLYLAILHARGAADSGKLARELKWDETRLRAAEQALYEMKLVARRRRRRKRPFRRPSSSASRPSTRARTSRESWRATGASPAFCARWSTSSARSRPRRSRNC